MVATNIHICTDSELEAEAQSVLAALGIDMTTAFNIFLTQMVDKKSLPFALEKMRGSTESVNRAFQIGCMKGEIWMSDDFDAPLDSVVSPEQKPKMSRAEVFGCMRGKFNIPDDFDAPIEDFKEYME